MGISTLDWRRPSAWADRLVPAPVRSRFHEPYSKLTRAADLVALGEGEAARAQRMALFAFCVRIASAALAYLSQVFLARILGGFEYGVFVLVWTVVLIAGYLSCLGFPSSIVRFVPRYRVRRDADGLRGVVLGARLIAGGVATVIAFLATALLWFAPDVVASYYVLPFFVALVCLPVLAIGDVQDGISRSFDLKGPALVPTFLLRPALVLAAMVVAILSGWPTTATTALGATVVAAWATTIVQLIWLARGTRSAVERGPRRSEPRVWLAVSLPIFLVEGFFQLLTNIDILMVGRAMSPEDVAVYFAAVKTLALVHFVYFAVKAGAAHRYSHYHEAGDSTAYEDFVRRTVGWTFWPSLLMGALIVLVGPVLLDLFGEGFSRGAPLLWILVIGIVARSAVGPAEAVLTMSGEQNACAIVYALTLLVNVALNLTLLPLYGLHGAAVATCCALIFEALGLFAIVRRRLGFSMFVGSRSS